MAAKLILSTTNRVDEGLVRAVPEPEFTKTWHPVSHAKVIDSLQAACDYVGVGIVSKEYSLNTPGTRMFGAWELDFKFNGNAYTLVLRNSIDKSMVIAAGGGIKTFNCDNLTISADYLMFHKHTSGLDLDRLNEMSKNALTGAWVNMEKLEGWFRKLREFRVRGNGFKALIYDLMRNGAIKPGQFNAFHNAHADEVAARGPGTYFDGTPINRPDYTDLGKIQGACTRLMRGTNLFNVAERNKKVIGVCDDYINMVETDGEYAMKEAA